MARLRQLVVVIPGIGGSTLAGPSDGDGGGYALTVGGLARTVFSPGRLDLATYPELVPTGLVTDLALVPPLLTLPGYARLYQLLRRAFLDPCIDVYRPPAPVHPRTDVLMFPYDFRRSVAETAARLDEAVEAALAARDHRVVAERPVIVVAHSLGGLVARHWIAVEGGWRRCAALLTLGTPHRGAPKALDWLVNGAGVGPARFRRMTEVIRAWPSVYELLPQYEAVWDEAAQAPFELTELPESLLAAQPDLVEYAPVFAKRAKEARLVHAAIREGWATLDPDRRPAVIPFLARGHATPNLATLDGGRLRVVKQDPPWRDNVGSRGDGTVPYLSAIPHELGEDRHRHLRHPVPDRHGPIGSTPRVIELLRNYAEDAIPVRGGDRPDRPWLGLDLDEFALADQPVPVAVTLLPEGQTGTRAYVTVTPLESAQPIPRVELASAGPDESGPWCGGASCDRCRSGHTRWRSRSRACQ